MGGGEKKKTNVMSQEQYAKENTAADLMARQQAAGRELGQQHAADLYGTLRSGYGNLMQPGFMQSLIPGGGYQAASYSARPEFGEALQGYRNFAQTGGIDEERMRAAHPSYQNFIQTGGIDTARQKDIDETIGMLKEFGRSGGVSEADRARMRGGGGYEEFAKTGGLSEEARQNIRSRATSVIPAAYQRATDEANRMRTLQGGYGPGATALRGRMLRESNQSAADAALNAELGIQQQVNQGRQFGIQGMSGSEQALQSLVTGNQLAGMSGSGQLGMSLANAIQQGRMFGTSGLDASERAIQGMLQSGRQFGVGGIQSVAGDLQSIQNANAAAGASAANANADLALRSYQAGLGGLESLYQGGPGGEISYADAANLANRGQLGQTTGNIMQQRYANNPSFMDRLPSIIGAAGSLAGGAAGFMAPFMQPRPQQRAPLPAVNIPQMSFGLPAGGRGMGSMAMRQPVNMGDFYTGGYTG